MGFSSELINFVSSEENVVDRKEPTMKGIIAFSFGLADNEPNSANRILAEETMRIFNELDGDAIIVAQWEIALALPKHLDALKHVVREHRDKDRYLDSDEVMAQAVEVFRAHGVTEVIPVAHPFLHLTKCRGLVEAEGFQVVDRKIAHPGWPKDSNQPWTRGPVRLLVYAVKQKLFGSRG